MNRRRCPVHETRGIREIQHRIALRAELHALIFGGQKAAAPLAVGQRLIVRIAASLRNHHHECRQILVLAAQSIGQPCADDGPPGELESGLEKRHRRIVIDGLGVHGLDEADVVRHLGDVRQQFADPGARLPVLLET